MTSRLSDEELDKLRGMYAAATKGPWASRLTYVVGAFDGIGRPTICDMPDVPSRQVEHNAKLIVALHNAFPALLEEITRLREGVMVPVSVLKKWRKDLDGYWFSTSDGEEYNNDEIIAMSNQIDAMLQASPQLAGGEEK